MIARLLALLLIAAAPAGVAVAQTNTLWTVTYSGSGDPAGPGHAPARSVYLLEHDSGGNPLWHATVAEAGRFAGSLTHRTVGGELLLAEVARISDGEHQVRLTVTGANGFTLSQHTYSVSQRISIPEEDGREERFLKEWRLSLAVDGSVFVLMLGNQPTTTESESADDLPGSLVLMQNYPNPFNPSTAIPYRLSGPAHVSLNVYDALGRTVRTVVEEVQKSGEHVARFDAADLPSGTYFYTLRTGGRSETRKMLLLR